MESNVEPYPAAANDPDRTETRVYGADASTYLRLGTAYAQKGCYEQAIEVFQQAISLQPDSAHAYLGLGGVYLEMRCRQEAANAFQQAIRIQPDLMEAHYGYGICSGEMGRFEEAILALEQARILLSSVAVRTSIDPSGPTVPEQAKPGLFSRLPRLSLSKRKRSSKSHGPTPLTLRARRADGPLTWKQHLRNPRTRDAILLTGFLAILGTGGFLLAPLFQGEPDEKPNLQQTSTTVSNPIKPNTHPALLAHRSDVASPDALIHAVEAGDVAAARAQLDENISADTRSKDGTPLLVLATDKNDFDMVDELLDRNADPNAQDADGQTSLMHAVDGQHPEIVKNLLKRGASVRSQSVKGVTALMYAATNEDRESIKLLAKHGADLNTHAGNNDTALTFVTALGKRDMVKQLLDLGADPTQPGENGKTALETATRQGRQDILDLLKKSTSGREINHSLSLAR